MTKLNLSPVSISLLCTMYCGKDPRRKSKYPAHYETLLRNKVVIGNLEEGFELTERGIKAFQMMMNIDPERSRTKVSRLTPPPFPSSFYKKEK